MLEEGGYSLAALLVDANDLAHVHWERRVTHHGGTSDLRENSLTGDGAVQAPQRQVHRPSAERVPGEDEPGAGAARGEPIEHGFNGLSG
jgi:hypothetical protein